MILRADRGGRVDLIDPDQFRELKIVVDPDQTADATAAMLGDGVRVEDDSHIWIPAGTIFALAGAQSAEWDTQFRAMLRSVERSGWYDAGHDAVRVHIEINA